jgi:transcriptional regulator with XRE-family HTH domain
LDRLISQAELADRAGVTIATLSRLERGAIKPHFTTLRKLARALKVQPQDLIDRPVAADAAAD